MKKLLFLAFVLILACSLFVACGDGAAGTDPVTDTAAGSDSDTSDDTTDGGGDVSIDVSSLATADLVDGAIYRISTNEEDTFEKAAMTVQNFGMEDNSMVKLDMYEKSLSQMWRVHKNDDGTYSFENMATCMYMSIRNPDSIKKERKLSACLDGTNDQAKSWNVYTVDGTITNCVIKNVFSGQYATAVASTKTKNYAEQAETYTGAVAQSWSFKKLSDGDGEYPHMLVLSGDYEGSASCPEIIYHNGVYYNYNMTGTITVKTSTDMLHWTTIEGKYALATRPTWLADIVKENDNGVTGIWAPGCYKIGDKFFLYYCSSSSGSQNSCIGVAVSDDPAKNDWKDLGLVIRSYDEKDKYGNKQTASNFNAIDPNVFIDDDGTPYLIYGSYWSGVYMKELNPNTGKFANPNAEPIHLAEGNAELEAPYLVKHGDYYYLFIARGGLSKGTYYWAVARSKTLEGPYVDKEGNAMLNKNGGTRLTEWKEGVQGAAHAQLFFGPDGQTYMVTESWKDRSDENGKVNLTIGTVVWTKDGWPVTALDKNVLKALGE